MPMLVLADRGDIWLAWDDSEHLMRALSYFHALNLLLYHGECLSSTRYRARVAYDGASFVGFQLQPHDSRTVQGVLEEVLSQRCNQNVRVIGSGRTDAGVHARGQAIHFDLDNDFSDDELHKIEAALNKMLPRDIAVYNLHKAPPPFLKTINGLERIVKWNVRYDSTSKWYSYRLNLALAMHPIDRHNRWHPDFASQINVSELDRLLKYYEGTHDFRAFASGVDRLEQQQQGSLNTVRVVYEVKLKDEGNGNHRIDFLLKGALYKQIRNMVATVLDVCLGRVSESAFLKLLDGSHRKDNRSKPAPPQGLTLEFVYFDDDSFDTL